MSASTTAAGTTGRAGTSTVYFLPPHWGRIAERLAPVIDREDGVGGDATRALILVPDAGAAVELAAALRTARPECARILPVTDALRGARLLKASGAPIVILSTDDAERLMAASALPLDGISVVGLVGADELDADRLAPLMAGLPKDARRVLVAADATPAVEALLERYFHKAHRLSDDSAAETTPAAVQYLLTRGSTAATLVPSLLDDLDPPSSVVVTTDDAGVRAALAAAGYPADTALVTVSEGETPENVALVIFAGLPTPAAFDVAMQAQPGRAVAIIAPRQLATLKRMAGTAGVSPFVTRRATSQARAHDERVRAELMQALTASYPAREILALEPLLAEFDGVELAGAALRLLEQARTVAPKPSSVAPAASTVVRSVRVERPRPKDADGFPLREPRPERAKPRFEDRTVRRDAGADRPRRSFGDKPREGGTDRPRRSFSDKPREGDERPRGSYGDKKRTFGDKPRGSFGDKPRGSFGGKREGGFGDKRGGFGAKPRGAAPRRPKDDR